MICKHSRSLIGTFHWLSAIAVFAAGVILANTAGAAQVSFQSTPPTVGPNDIANLTGAAVVGNNVASGDPNASYFADDRPIQGQTFTTGSNPAGYQLTAVTVRQVTYNTYALVPDLTYTIRINSLPASPPGRLTVLATETASVPASTPGNFPTINGGDNQGPGSGAFITFTLANPVALTPNTTYAFDIGGGTTRHYWESDGTSSNPYAGGTAYSSGAGGIGNTTRTTRTGDHVFIVALTLPGAPVVSPPTVSPTNVVYAGTPVTLSVSAAGSPPLRYQWRWDDGLGPEAIMFDIPGANSTNLVINTTGLSGTYYYHVVVTNSSGSVTSAPISLTVNPASVPVITQDTTPSAATRYVGQEITFMASFDGTPPITYQWLRFGQPIPGETNTTLTLTDLELSDADPYSLIASNFAGTAESSVAPLTILTPPAPPAPGSYSHAALTNGPIAYWRFNDPAGTQFIYDSADTHNASNINVTLGVPGLQSPAYPGFPSGNTAASFAGDGAASSGVGLLNGLTNFTVLGWFSPTGPNGPFSGLFGQNDVLEVGYSDGAGVNLWVQLNGIWRNPRTGTNGFAIDQWYFVAVVADGAAVDIYINAVQRAHEAEGMPTATSPFGFNVGGGGIFGSSGDHFTGLIQDIGIYDRALSQAEIQSLYDTAAGAGPPSILTQPQSQALYPGRTARFTAGGISGTAPLTYQWQHAGTNISNGGNISGSDTSSLRIGNVSSANVGNYQLIVSNSAGSVTSSVVTLTVVSPTGTPYESAASGLNPLAYWRLNETDNPAALGVLAHDYVGGFAGTYGAAAQNGFHGVAGPVPVDGFSAFESTNRALQTAGGIAPSDVTIPGLSLNTNTVSFTMWIKPSGVQHEYAGLLMTRDGTDAGIGYGGTFEVNNVNQLIYTWNEGTTWRFQSGLVIPSEQWSFVAVVIQPDKATLYLYNANAQLSATNPIPHTSETWAGTASLGSDPNHSNRNFNGVIDEVAVFNYALTPAQVLDLYNGSVTPEVTLTIQRSGSNLLLGWPEGVLEEATSLNGTWGPVSGAAAPSHTVTPSGTKFYRVRVTP